MLATSWWCRTCPLSTVAWFLRTLQGDGLTDDTVSCSLVRSCAVYNNPIIMQCMHAACLALCVVIFIGCSPSSQFTCPLVLSLVFFSPSTTAEGLRSRRDSGSTHTSRAGVRAWERKKNLGGHLLIYCTNTDSRVGGILYVLIKISSLQIPDGYVPTGISLKSTQVNNFCRFLT